MLQNILYVFHCDLEKKFNQLYLIKQYLGSQTLYLFFILNKKNEIF